jgi:gamma-glutamylcyclotransferase (GGCT)/AIG2-like uncharacterized protein YtfP
MSGGETGPLPFFVYGTLRPGEHNHDLFLRGRVSREEPARLDGAFLYEGPGYPYAVEAGGAAGAVVGELVTAVPSEYSELLANLDELEDCSVPGDPHNVYERVAREVLRAGRTPVRAWVYYAAPRVARELALRGRRIVGGDWLARGSGR